nr:hypothetical protein ANI_1_166174 [Aspergillus niger CBS 513.88]|eukprot:XP_003188802.1 hypothetical protein ANI_1_166174 [Aspergillus niger CBS 513.88]
MLIDGEKWACEACVRGHRVTTCKHNDRPLIRINRKGRPFATCSICNCTPCESPEEHAKLKPSCWPFSATLGVSDDLFTHCAAAVNLAEY